MSDGSVVAITGASAGVGRATARAFARRGARLGLLARGRAGLEATRRDVEALGGRAHPVATDVADGEAVDAAAEEVEDHLGPLDVWINNAMTSVLSPVRAMEAEEYRRVTEVTYLGYVHGVLAALQRMEARGGGTIVNVGSALAFRGIPLQSAYCAAKHAIQGFTDALRAELLHDESPVQVTEVHLPGLNTPQFLWVKSRLPEQAQPMPPIFQPEVAAEAIVHAVDHPRRHLWVGCAAHMTALGNRVAPRHLDRKLAAEGYAGQQAGEPPVPGPENLWSPADDEDDYGPRGRFSHRSAERSPHLWVNRHRGTLGALGAGAVAGAALGLLLNGRGP